MAADWTQLPGDLLQSISKKITVHSDYIRFRAVCSEWRCSVPRVPPTQFPWLMLPLISQSQPQSHRCFYDISADKTHSLELPEASRPELRIGSSNGWLIILDDSPTILLLNPLTRAKLYLPPLFSFPNVVSFDYSEVNKEYAIQDVSTNKIHRVSLRGMRNLFIKKIVMSSGPLNNDGSFIAVAILKTGELAYCKNGDQSWTFMRDEGLSFSCCDVTYYKEQFYAVDRVGKIAICNTNDESPSVVVIKSQIPPRLHITFYVLYLVNSGDDELLLVVRYLRPAFSKLDRISIVPLVLSPTSIPYFETGRVNVFKMMNYWNGIKYWNRIENLGDRLLFVGENSSLSLSASDVYGQSLENRIYFTDDNFQHYHYDNEYFDHGSNHNVHWDRGIYKLSDKSIISLPCLAQDPHAHAPYPHAHALWVTLML